ncbi:hypothetical protein GCM10009856_51680 [Mycolicibacterium llatzerense]
MARRLGIAIGRVLLAATGCGRSIDGAPHPSLETDLRNNGAQWQARICPTTFRQLDVLTSGCRPTPSVGAAKVAIGVASRQAPPSA